MTARAKEELRRHLLDARRALSPEERAARSRAIAARVAALPAFAAARTVALYAPIGAEVDTGELASLAARTGKRVAWPRLEAGGRRLSFASCAPEELQPGPHRTRVPPPGAPAVPLDAIDLLCVPGVGFDGSRRRLGRGGGWYDATLAGAPGRPLRVGLAFECQLVAAVPAEAHDVPVDAVATELRLLDGSAG